PACPARGRPAASSRWLSATAPSAMAGCTRWRRTALPAWRTRRPASSRTRGTAWD
ncbi:hypothetical protein XPN_3234, partial [Xanthomonas arboricola pv. pruni MAFF 301427]